MREAGGDWAPIDRTNFAMTAAHDLAHNLMRDLVDTLTAMRLRVALVYPESGPGQFELTIDHAAALGAADRHVLLRDAVRGVAYRHDAAASFAPKPLPNSAGSGCHLHLSVWRGGRNVLYGERDALHLSREGYAWVAGLLDAAQDIHLWLPQSRSVEPPA